MPGCTCALRKNRQFGDFEIDNFLIGVFCNFITTKKRGFLAILTILKLLFGDSENEKKSMRNITSDIFDYQKRD